MNKRIKVWMWATLLCATSMFGQTKNITVSGRVIEAGTNEPVIQATVQLLSLPDSTYINGAATVTNGNFTLPKAKAGRYALKFSYIGFKTKTIPLTLKAEQLTRNIGNVTLEPDAILLSEAVVTAEAPQVQAVEDTLVYNSSAYRTPEGAMLEELVKKLPGAEVSDDGTVKVNGKEVKKLMVNGKEFFGGDVSTGLKNLPVDMVDKLKTYDKKSDLTRITGIDDGEEETVLDLTVKKGMNQGLFGNIDLAGGTKDRYSLRGMVNYFRDNTQVSFIGRGNNVNDRGFSGGGGGPRFNRNNGLTTQRMFGLNFATENSKIELGGSVRYNFSDNDAQLVGYSETFLSGNQSSTFKNSNSINRNKTDRVSANFRLEWKPDSMTNIIFRPNFSFSKGNRLSTSENATFNSDPYAEKYTSFNPNDYLNLEKLLMTDYSDPFNEIRVNTANTGRLTKTKSISTDGTLQLNRKLSSNGRNITFRGRYSYSDSNNDQFSESQTLYNLLQSYVEGKDSLRTQNQYITRPTDKYSLTAQLTYSEPIAKATFLQLSYRFQYSFNKSDRKTYDLFDDRGNGVSGYGSNPWTIEDGENLPDGYLNHPVTAQDKYAEYRTYGHEAMATLRFVRKMYQMNVGVSFQPQHTDLSYQKGDYMTDTVRNVANFAPNFDFQYKFSKQSQLRMTYRGSMGQPDMEDLLPITDTSDPMSIKNGNPGLKPSFTHNFRLFYNTFNSDHQRSIVSHINFSATQNSISSMREYNAQTGGWVTTPQNINGNWNVFGMFGINTALKNKRFTIGSFTTTRFSNNVAYLTSNKVVDKNTTTDLTLGERLNASYRNSWFEFGVNGTISYTMERDRLQAQNNQNPYTYSFGANTQITLPWRMTLSTNITDQARRGYSDSNMNKNELIWNAQLSQTFLKGSLSLSLEWNDILAQQSNISRSYTSSGRSVYQYNGINSYGMFHVIYRLNLFGSKSAREKMRNSRQFGPGGYPGRRGGMPMGPPPGGFGGGRPF